MPQSAAPAAVAAGSHVPAIVPQGAYVYQPQAGGSHRGLPGQPAGANATRMPVQNIFLPQSQRQTPAPLIAQQLQSSHAPAARSDRSSESPPVLPARERERDVPLERPQLYQQSRTPSQMSQQQSAYKQLPARTDAAQVSVR